MDVKMVRQEEKKMSYEQGKTTYGTLRYMSIFIALTDVKEVVEDFEFDGIVTDVLRTTGIDEENRLYEIFWIPKPEFMINGKYIGTQDDIENGTTAYNFTRPLTCRRTDWKAIK